ncbi:hypothetical protein BDV96DRAFT_486632 [Lophiotrema nucula]|uniref:NmrA-like domain-containing protein n=1 Tax=Lophiotrema nucula TaxID=690887 RepID=A0A6A5ZKF8_9PLEO|nr:hypothetical protein BDV96DRAFT_486632 [Lophiotrema nucula]
MSKKLLVVFGATGQQGGSIADIALTDPELSQKYNVRAITRDANSSKAQALKSKGAEIVEADSDKPETLKTALTSANFVFAITITHYEGETRKNETRQAKAICDEAVKQGAEYIIWSSMSHPEKISGGNLKSVEHFDVKAEVEQYIRTLPVKSAHFAPGSFMQNLLGNQKPRPSPNGDGTYVMGNLLADDTKWPLIDITDTGKWVAAVLAEPDKYDGKFFAAAQGLYSNVEIAEAISKHTGKTVKHHQLPDEVFKGFLPPAHLKEWLFGMYLLIRDYGYYGKNMAEEVEWAKQQARGHLTTLEEFLKKVDYKLD